MALSLFPEGRVVRAKLEADEVEVLAAGDMEDGLTLRLDHGSQYLTHDFQDEQRFLGIRSSPSFVAVPEGNGVAERSIGTLKEQLLWVDTFDTIEDLRLAHHAFRRRYNVSWLVQKHPHRTPDQVRALLSPTVARAA
jgi:transposase InsO family protein